MKDQSAFPEPFVNDPHLAISHTKGMTLKDYAQIKFMAAIISNADTMRELTRAYNANSRNIEFEDMIANAGAVYADAMLKQREL